MDKQENKYCRFCAEQKSTDKLINLQMDLKICEETLLKLANMNVLFIDVSEENNLPKTICLVCYEALNKAHDFLNKVKESQDVLTDLFKERDTSKFDVSDDDRTALDDYLDTVENNEIEIKEEKLSPTKRKQDDKHFHTFSHDVQIKLEPKEEFNESTCINSVIERIQESSIENANSLNVQDFIDAAISSPYSSNVTIYAKELSDLSKKIVKSWKDYPWVCAYCNMEFLDVVTLRSHSKIVHGKCAAFLCIECEVKYDFEPFVAHIRRHRKSLRNYCHYCDELLDKYVNLRSHVKQHFQKSQIACPACGEILKNEDVLQKHVLEYNTTKPKRKPRRKRGTPITVEDLTCKLCQKVYKNPNSLRDHMKLHTNDRKRNYTCDRCGKTFFNKGTLTSHIMSHDEIRPHVCRICNKSFLFPNMLRRHVQMHSGVKPFSCEQCGRCFRLQYQLNAHKIIHTDSMPHICQYCNKAFRFKQILKNHERQHTGVKPYSCKQCGMEFTNWSNYNKHMKRRHDVDTSKKKITPDGVFPVNPETGQMIQLDESAGTEEWRSKIMIPGKRGKKKVIKRESNDGT